MCNLVDKERVQAIWLWYPGFLALLTIFVSTWSVFPRQACVSVVGQEWDKNLLLSSKPLHSFLPKPQSKWQLLKDEDAAP